MKRHKWMPLAFFAVGVAVYIYYGVTWHAWMKNLPNIAIYAVVCAALWWAQKKKDEFNEKYK